MIQFKKIPPSKSVLLFLLFLTTNAYGFLRYNQNESRVTRKTQNLFSMDLQQATTQNMPIRRIGIDRVINEKDENSERLYDRRSFRTGTIQNIYRERSTKQESRTNVRDLNNNRQRIATHLQDRVQNGDNRRSFGSIISRENRQRIVRNRDTRRIGESAVISENRQYNERSLNTRTERNTDRNTDVRDRGNVKIIDLTRRINERTDIVNVREHRNNERREVRNRQPDRKLSERQVEGRLATTRSSRLGADRSSELPVRSLQRSIRSVDVREQRASERRNANDRRARSERLDMLNSIENRMDRRFVENINRRSKNRDINQRLSNEERNTPQRFRGNLEKNNLLDRRMGENRRSFNNRNADQSRLSSEERSKESRERQNILKTFSDRRNQLRDNRSRVRSERGDSRERLTVEQRDDANIRVEREYRSRTARYQTRRETQEFSRRSTRQRSVEDAERRDPKLAERQRIIQERVPDVRRTAERLQRINSRDIRTVPFQRRERDTNNADRNINSREQSRTDSTRYIHDNTYSKDVRSRVSRENVVRDNSRRDRITDRYNPLTVDSRNYFERIVSQRTTRDSTRSTEMPTLNLERNVDNNTYTWAGAAKIILAAFLIVQIFVNSSKANKLRLHNIVSMATSIKEKTH